VTNIRASDAVTWLQTGPTSATRKKRLLFQGLVSYEDAWDVERESLGQVLTGAVGWISLSEYERS